MSDEVQDEVAGQLMEVDEDPVVPASVGGPTAMDVVDSIQDELSSESNSAAGVDEVDKAVPVIKTGGLSIAPVKMASEVGEDGQKKVPGIKIIGLSSELKKAITGEDSKDTSVEDEEEEEDEDEEDGEEEEEDEDEDEEGEEDDEEEVEDDASSVEAIEVEPPAKVVKTPKVTIRKVQQVVTPGSGAGGDSTPSKMPFAGAGAVSTGKKRGRPSRADLAIREQERQEAMARGEPDPELKRKRRKPLKLNDADSEEDSREEKKKRKREEREERRKAKAKARSEDTEDTDGEDKPKKKGRKKKILTEEEEKEREEERKRKYKELREKQKEKLERRKNYLIQKREERKAKKAEEKIKQEEHMKRMAELRSQYLDDNASELPPDASFLLDENSQSSNSTFIKKKKAWGDVGLSEVTGIYNPLAHVTAETLFEYKWPLEGRHSEHYFLQEQVTEFMGVKSFKRKYPDCPRRTINMEERDFLIEMKIVNETQADLGLTAIPSAYVLDIMCAEFYDKYEEYINVVNERKERSLRNYNYSTGSGNIKIEEAVKAAAEYNKKFNKERKDQRGAYFDLQTFTCHYPKSNKGKMKVLKKATPGSYPVAMIPGQFVDHFKSYSSKELRLFPLNTATSAPPTKGLTTRDLNLGSDGSESDSGSSSSDSSSDSDSDSDSDASETGGHASKKKSSKADKQKQEASKPEEAPAPKRRVDEVRPLATCKHCGGNVNQNKIGVPEILLHCSKCNQSSHPTCVGLSLDLLQFVTSYDWECTDCKKCMMCFKSEDEDKMLFCDLCDRGYHIYCVGLSEIPGGRWHCGSCAFCVSCGTKCPAGEGEEDESLDWIFETKIDMKGNKVYSHTMCHPCHKQWKKGNFCPECNGVFGRSKYKVIASCWVCSRQHHAKCVGLEKSTDRFICSGCQRRTQEKTIAGGRKEEPRGATATPGNSFSRTPVTASYSRSGRRVTQINFANQF